MPFVNSVRSTFGPQQKAAPGSLNPWFISNPPVVYFNPDTYTTNASTWTDSISGYVLDKQGDGFISKESNRGLYMSSGTRWGLYGRSHISALDVGTGSATYEFWFYNPLTNYTNTGTGNNNNAGQPGTTESWRTIMTNGMFWEPGEMGIYVAPQSRGGNFLGFNTTNEYGLEYGLSNIGTGWKHLVMVRDTQGRKMYVNGTLAASDNTINTLGTPSSAYLQMNGFANASTTPRIFETFYGDKNFRYGRIRLYPSALSAGTVGQIYNLEKSIYGL